MARTLWMDTITDRTLDSAELAALRRKAHVVYAANAHIFEDEADALTALGVVSLHALDAEAGRMTSQPGPPSRS